MQRRYAATTALLVMGIAGCSSGPPPAKLPNGALPSGTAQFSVNESGTASTHDVRCERISGLTIIRIGQTGTRVTVLVDDARPKSVSFDDVQGFTGSYWQDIQGSARLHMVDQTYTLTGVAAGFNTVHPHTRTTDDFTVKFAC